MRYKNGEVIKERKCEICGKTEGRINNSIKFGKMLCDKHYDQMKNHGKILTRTIYDPNEFIVLGDIIEIVMYNIEGEESGRAIVDKKYYDIVVKYKWSLDTNGYAMFQINGKQERLHRIIAKAPKEAIVDHINHNILDNRESNLRICTKQENAFNQVIRSNNTSGYKGVHWNEQRRRWIAQIMVGGKSIYLGIFINLEDAIESRIKAEIKYFGEFRYQKEVM